MLPPGLVEHCAALTNVNYTNFALSLYVTRFPMPNLILNI